MIISDERFACALVDTLDDPDPTRLYDDIGDMLEDLSGETPDSRIAVWVRDFETGDWIDGREAVYLLSPRLSTPMGSGIAAFTDRSAAAAKLDEITGALHSFENILRTHK